MPLIHQCGSSADFECERFQTFPHASLFSVSPAYSDKNLGLPFAFHDCFVFYCCCEPNRRPNRIKSNRRPNRIESNRLACVLRSCLRIRLHGRTTQAVILNRQYSRQHTLYSSFIVLTYMRLHLCIHSFSSPPFSPQKKGRLTTLQSPKQDNRCAQQKNRWTLFRKKICKQTRECK